MAARERRQHLRILRNSLKTTNQEKFCDNCVLSEHSMLASSVECYAARAMQPA